MEVKFIVGWDFGEDGWLEGPKFGVGSGGFLLLCYLNVVGTLTMVFHGHS